MNKKLMSLALVSLIITGLFTGCGQTITNSSDKVYIEFSWWGNDKRHNYTMDGVDIFQTIENNIDVTYRYGEWSGYERKNRVWMESNTEADVMQINYAWLNEYSEDGLGFYDLNELSEYIDLSSYDESDLAFGMKNGKLNAIPIAFNTSTLCFNKNIYDNYGLDYPKSWDDLFAVAEVLSQDDIYTLGMAKKHLLLMLIAYYEQTTGKNVFDTSGKLLIDEEGFGYMLDFYKKMIDKKVLMPVDQFERGKFGDGEVSASLFWVSDADNYCGALEKNGCTAEFSTYFQADNSILTGLYMKPATMYAISAISDNPKESAMLLDYLINNPGMAILQGTEKGVPASKKAIATLENEGSLDTYGYVAYKLMDDNKEDMNIMIPAMESENIINAFKENADAYIYQVEDRETTMKNIYDSIKGIVDLGME